MKQIHNFDCTVGKTIAGYAPDKWDENWIITFTDGTFLYIHSSDESYVTFDDKFDLVRNDFVREQLVEIGVLSREDYQAELDRIEKAEEEKRSREEQRERELFEKLKKKFEG